MLTRGDAVVLALVAMTAGWTWISGLGRDADPRQALLLLGGVGVTYLAGRIASCFRGAVTVVGAGIAAAAALAVLVSPGALSGEPLAGPLGYGNANGALCALGAGAALVAGLSREDMAMRLAGVLGALGMTVLAVLTLSRAAAVLAAVLTAVGLVLALRPTAGRPIPVLGVLVVIVSLAGTASLGLVQPSAAGSDVVAELSERRTALWGDALELVERDPLRGVGPGRFAVESALAREDDDARWAHSLWLQSTAETGVPGLVLLVALGVTALLRVQADGWEDGGVPAVGALVTTAVLVHASVDYVMHFAVVPLLAAALAGLTVSARDVRGGF